MLVAKIARFLPRILSVVFVAFISFFALDVFGQPNWFIALMFHLLPSFILTFATLIAWQKPATGGVLFGVLAILISIASPQETLIFSIPMLIIGTLFFLSEVITKKIYSRK